VKSVGLLHAFGFKNYWYGQLQVHVTSIDSLYCKIHAVLGGHDM